jgi:polysaccharide biosynthesis transport protein
VRRLLVSPPLAAIPHIGTASERERSRRIVRMSMGAAAVAVISLIAAVHFLVLPLDVLWLGLLRRLGI